MLWLLTMLCGAAFGFVVSPRVSNSVADSVAGWVVMGVSLWTSVRVLTWWIAKYVITDQRVLLIEGLLAVRVSAIPLTKVTDTTFTRTFLGRIFGYGDLLLDAPGEQPGIATLTRIPRPTQLYRLITSLVVGRVWERQPQSVDEEDTGPLPRVIL